MHVSMCFNHLKDPASTKKKIPVDLLLNPVFFCLWTEQCQHCPMSFPNLLMFALDNIDPLLIKFKGKIKIWKRLPLSVAGRCNLIKMIWLPQLLYVLHNSPIWLYKKWFPRIETLFRELIWKGGPAKIRLSTLQLQKQEGGVALPHPFSYYLASQLQYLGGCNVAGQEAG